jgi:lysophospholipase L1-like esterase
MTFELVFFLVVVLFVIAVVIAYYNYVAGFRRIHLYGKPRKRFGSQSTGFGSMSNLSGIFEKKDDLVLLQLLMERKLPLVVCFGDSITQGIVSTNYVEKLEEKYKNRLLFVNSGINGNLAYNCKMRLQSDCIDFDPDFVTILIGTNDVNALKNEKTMRNYMREMQLPQKPDIDFFKANYEEIIVRIKKETRAKIAVMSLPFIGENVRSELNLKTTEYSHLIRELAIKHEVAYLPLQEAERDLIEKLGRKKPTNHTSRHAFLIFLLMIGRSFDKIAAQHGDYLTYDGLHATTLGAKVITDLIAGFLDENK